MTRPQPKPKAIVPAETLPPRGATLARLATGIDRILGPAIVIAAIALGVAWFLPMMTVERLFFWEREISIMSGLAGLFEHGQYFLFAVILVFTIVFPLLKLTGAYALWFHLDQRGPRARRYAGLLHALGRWSMLDVFVVALMVVAINVSIVSDVEIHGGIYVFSAAIIASMVVVQRIERLMTRAIEAAPAESD